MFLFFISGVLIYGSALIGLAVAPKKEKKLRWILRILLVGGFENLSGTLRLT